jgi:hypothetical protein
MFLFDLNWTIEIVQVKFVTIIDSSDFMLIVQ